MPRRSWVELAFDLQINGANFRKPMWDSLSRLSAGWKACPARYPNEMLVALG